MYDPSYWFKKQKQKSDQKREIQTNIEGYIFLANALCTEIKTRWTSTRLRNWHVTKKMQVANWHFKHHYIVYYTILSLKRLEFKTKFKDLVGETITSHLAFINTSTSREGKIKHKQRKILHENLINDIQHYATPPVPLALSFWNHLGWWGDWQDQYLLFFPFFWKKYVLRNKGMKRTWRITSTSSWKQSCYLIPVTEFQTV